MVVGCRIIRLILSLSKDDRGAYLRFRASRRERSWPAASAPHLNTRPYGGAPPIRPVRCPLRGRIGREGGCGQCAIVDPDISIRGIGRMLSPEGEGVLGCWGRICALGWLGLGESGGLRIAGGWGRGVFDSGVGGVLVSGKGYLPMAGAGAMLSYRTSTILRLLAGEWAGRDAGGVSIRPVPCI